MDRPAVDSRQAGRVTDQGRTRKISAFYIFLAIYKIPLDKTEKICENIYSIINPCPPRLRRGEHKKFSVLPAFGGESTKKFSVSSPSAGRAQKSSVSPRLRRGEHKKSSVSPRLRRGSTKKVQCLPAKGGEAPKISLVFLPPSAGETRKINFKAIYH